MSDEEIIELFWQRSEDAVSAAAERFGPGLRAIARNILRDDRDAGECVNDAYYQAWESIPPNRPRSLSAYLGRITRNIALNRYRRSAAQKRGGGQTELALSELEDCIPTVVSLEAGAEEGAVTACIEAYLRTQPKEKRRVFVRRYWYLSPLREIARDYGISESKVKSMLFRMRKELKACLDKEGIEL